jgi:hypothetical protein
MYREFLFLKEGCRNPERQIALSTLFFMDASNICGSWAWNLLCFTYLAPRILMWFLDLWKSMCTPVLKIMSVVQVSESRGFCLYAALHGAEFSLKLVTQGLEKPLRFMWPHVSFPCRRVRVLSQINPVRTLSTCCFEIHFNIIFWVMP